LRNLAPHHRRVVLGKRAAYELGFRELIDTGRADGEFRVESAQLASYSILDMGIGVSAWFRRDAGPSEDEVVSQYADFALRLVGA
jgi:hypothetical protein